MKVLIAFTLLLLIQSCSLCEKEERFLNGFTKSNNDKINIYYVQPGATANDVIQVRINKPHESERLIKAFERNYLAGSKLINDSSLQLILSDTGYHNYNNKADTIIVNVN